MPMPESVPTTDQTRVEFLTNQELNELKDDNERLRKTLSVLHIHSLRLTEQRDRLLDQRDELVNAFAVIGGCMRADPQMEQSSSSSLGHFDDDDAKRAGVCNGVASPSRQ
jgi:hypothetical protein